MRIIFQYLVPSIFLICFVSDIDAQEKSIEKANILYDRYAYVDAIESYKNIIIEGHGSVDIYKRLADCYYLHQIIKMQKDGMIGCGTKGKK